MPILTRRFDLSVHAAAELVREKERAVLLSSGHSVVAVDLQDGTTRELATGYAMPGGIAASPDGAELYVVDLDPAQSQFTLYRVAVGELRAGAELGKGVAILHAAGTPGQIAVDAEHLYYADRVTGDLVSIQIAGRTELREVPPSVVEVPLPLHAVEAGSPIGVREATPVVVGGFGHRPDLPVRTRSTVLAGGLQDPIGVGVDPGTKRIFVTEQAAGRVVSIAAGETSFTVERLGIAAPQMISVDADSGALLVPGFAMAGTVDALTPGTHEVERVATLTAFDRPLYVLRVGDRLVCVEARGIRWWDIFGHPQRPVTITLADSEPFIGSYQRVEVDLGTSGIAFADLEFVLDAGDEAGRISYSRDDLSAANEIMLLVGYQSGPHTIKAIDTTTSATVASADYEITDKWTTFGVSPARWSIGELASFQTGYTWGGGPSTPQNVDVFPQSGTRHICMLMVDVSDARYPSGSTFDTLTQTWQDGAVGPAPSARTYYEEVSHGGFTLALSGSTVPHVQLSTSWSDNFSTMPTPWPSNSFQPNDGSAFAQACISAAAAMTDGSGNPLVDFGEVQSLILVIRSKGSGSSDDFFWAQAWGGSFTIPGGSRNMNVLGMPDDWVSSNRGGGRTIYETLSHEMGHNLGYPDLYTNVPDWHYSADVISRDITDFDLMSAEAELPHMSIAQKMECGWVRPEWIQLFDFSRSTIPLSQTVTLNAVEAGAPPAGQFAGIEIRIADGWNYYFEYRKGQSGQIGDQQLASNPSTDTGDGVVLGTDVLSQNFTYPIARPQIIRLRPDAEGEHSFFSSGQDYKETDTSSMAIADFRLTVLSTSGNTAQVRVEYGTNGRPDLYIRPWPGGNDYQSPDIEVRNARSMADPAHWTNVPWAEHANTVIARYRNRGPVTCRNVKVDFFVKDYTVSNAPEVWIGSDTKDVPPESTTAFVEFTANWLPPDEGHRCIIARTPLYIDTSINPNIVELSDSNNSAQSNYTHYISASSSPGKREITSLTLHNPYDTRAEMYVVPQITGPFSDLYRLYLEHTALMLDPGESRPVQVMVESMYGDPHSAGVWREKGEKIFFYPTKITFTGYGIPPESTHPQILGGAEMTVGSGHATRFTSFGGDKKEGVVRGAVEVVDSGGPATGFVLVTFHGPDESVDNTVKAPLDPAGHFFLRGMQELIDKLRATKVTAHYPGRPGYAPCDAPNTLEL